MVFSGTAFAHKRPQAPLQSWQLIFETLDVLFSILPPPGFPVSLCPGFLSLSLQASFSLPTPFLALVWFTDKDNLDGND